MPKSVEAEIRRERDLLWCRALLASGLDPRDIQRILGKFNRMRPDKPQKGEAS